MPLSNRINNICIGAIIFSLLAIPALSLFAHTEGGGTYETEVGDYFVDIGYYPEILEAGVPSRLDFEVYHNSEDDDVPYSNVWVRIEQGAKTIFATGVYRPEFGTTGLLYTFPESGTYTIYARFQNDDESIAEVTFPLEIVENSDASEASLFDSKYALLVFGGVLGLFVGAVGGFVLKRRNNKKKDEASSETVDSSQEK